MAPPGTDTRQRLIDTALELMWKNSYGSVSVDDICKAADAKKGSFYHYFPSKVELAVAAMEESHRAGTSRLDSIFSPENAPVRRFELLADYIYESQAEVAARYGKVCGCPLGSVGSEMAGQEAGIRAKFDDLTLRKKRYYETALRDMVAEGILPETTDIKAKAHEIYTHLLGQMMIARIENDLAPLKRDLKNGLFALLGLRQKDSRAA